MDYANLVGEIVTAGILAAAFFGVLAMIGVEIVDSHRRLRAMRAADKAYAARCAAEDATR